MRLLLPLLVLLLTACQTSVTPDGSEDAVPRQQQSPDSIQVINATGAPVYVIHMPARAARPVRQEVTLDVTTPPAGYLAPDSAMALPNVTCESRDQLEGDALLLYRVGAPDAGGQATATLASTRPLTAEVLAALADNDCRLVIDALGDE